MLGKRESLAKQLKDILNKRINESKYKPGEKIPTEKELSEEFSVSRTVIREAIASLKI